MESAITALQCEPVSPEEGEYLPPGSHQDCGHSSHSLQWTLRKLRMQDYRPQMAEVHTREIILVSPGSWVFPYVEKD